VPSHTAEMAHAVAKGAASAGDVTVVEHEIAEADLNQGRWMNEAALAALDESDAIISCATFAMQHGMVWTGLAESPVKGEGYNRLGFFLGAAGFALFEPPSEMPNANDRQTGEMLGRRVAALTMRMASSPKPE